MSRVEPPGSGRAADPDLLHEFQEFYKTTFHRTFGTAYRAAGGDAHVAEDATQEAYVVMLKRWLDNKKPQGNLYCYVVGIAVRKVIDIYRSRDGEVLEEEHDCGNHEPGYDRVLDGMTVLAAVRNLLDRQPPRRRAVGALYFLEELDYPEIAETLGMSCSTARTHVQRLREALKPLIDRITRDGLGGERP
jgi:RNA polymerase sigma factor (sigma-70 family)